MYMYMYSCLFCEYYSTELEYLYWARRPDVGSLNDDGTKATQTRLMSIVIESRMSGPWIDTFCHHSLHTSAKARERWQLARGGVAFDAVNWPPAESASSSCQQYVVHVVGGLEALASEELRSIEGCRQVQPLQGKVIFESDAPLEVLRGLRSAELLSLCCWAVLPPQMPTNSPEAWLDRFDAIIIERGLPRLRGALDAWRTAVGHAEASVRFRATVKRGGEKSAAAGITSTMIAARLGAVCVEHLGWIVALVDFDCEVVLQWSDDSQVVLELPITNQRKGGEAARISHRSYLCGTLHGPIAWSLAMLAQMHPGDVVLDPMVGKGGVLLEASVLEPSACCIGIDSDAAQLDFALANARRLHQSLEETWQQGLGKGASGRVEAPRIVLHPGDCTRLPLRAGCVDCVITDLPFGKRHKAGGGAAEQGLHALYARAVDEMRRVLRMGGTAVCLTSQREGLSRLVCKDPAWTPISRHEVSLGSFKASAIVFRRQAPPLLMPMLAPPPPPTGSAADGDADDGDEAREAGRAAALFELARGVATSRRFAGRGASTRIALTTRPVPILGHTHQLPVRADGDSWVATAPINDVGAALDAVGAAPMRHRHTMLVALFEREAHWPQEEPS